MPRTPPGRLLTDPRGGRSFRFDAGAVCLDFAHTGGEGKFAVFESWHEPADLAAWLAEPPLSAVLTEPPSTGDLRAAKRLRQAIWVTAHDQAAGRALTADAIAALNSTASPAPLVPVLDHRRAHVSWAAPVRARAALSSLAREMIELLAGPAATRIRECDSVTCPMVFVDLSRPGTRRWCAMERCGNRHKQDSLRARRASEPGSRGTP